LPSPVPPLDGRLRRSDQKRWLDWRRQLGRRLRALRELTGLSQERLSRLAGTNQAAVSRLEGGTGLVSLALLARIGPALAASLIDRTVLSAEGERLLSALETLAPSGLEQWLPITHDPGLRDMLQCYMRATDAQKKTLLAVAKALQ
jgi:transcriptional regulator with XRE-family HTH domain